MNIDHFWKLMEKPPQQDPGEWMAFLEFVEGYFNNRYLSIPIIWEIGVRRGNQKRFWTDLLGYHHLGIDINPKFGPDIVGDSASKETRTKAMAKTGETPQLIFIDGNHKYESVCQDFRIWGPMATDLIAFHDVMMGKRAYENVRKMWGETLANKYFNYTTVQFFTNRGRFLKPKNMGIGVLVKWSEKCINHPLMK